jgi:sugar phosphate permease
MIGGRAPVTTPPNVVMGYPMGGQTSNERLERSAKEQHHSPAPAMQQQVCSYLSNKTILFLSLHVIFHYIKTLFILYMLS